ncbi:MAG: MBL fold metallo-hydrolase [Oscillospiraceae bacterium]|nr:MBL fold metallo-hydrolase [Oscillospiraceae bacterium]
MNKKRTVILLSLLAAVLIVGAGVYLYSASNQRAQAEKVAEENDKGLKRYSEFEIFADVPAMTREDVVYQDAIEAGGGDYMIIAEDTAMEDYQDYLSVLEKEGFKKVLDNGEQGLEGYVYTSHYQKENLLVVVSYIKNLKQTTITAAQNAVLSDRLYRDDSAVSTQTNAKIKMHVYEFESVGMGFVFELKSGHFLLYDGGTKVELPHLVNYLESLVPEGQKPIIDAWFISHAHGDHMGILTGIAENRSYADRMYIDSVYFFDPPAESVTINGDVDGVPWNLKFCNAASEYLKASDGGQAKMYRPRLGERYYFEDITIDIIYTPELSPAEDWDTFNASSIVTMMTIEGQKVLLTGDADWSSQLIYTDMYDKEYFNLTIYQVPHHGINVYKQITNRLGTIQTVVYPAKVVTGGAGPASFTGRKPQNEHLMSLAPESFAFGDGTRILTFPYQVGTAEKLPPKFSTEE